jgi:Na+-transporting NADH:ubiquinone oxidoreductase subunit C
MKTNSNSYTIIYASVIVVIVAFLLAFTNQVLKTRQDTNIQLDTKKQILASLNIRDVKDVEAQYKANVQSDMLLQADGTLVANSEPFASNYGKEIEKGRYHVFVCKIKGDTKYVFPLTGVGLWGGIWGYVSLNSDLNTVYGTYFSHQSETPGLGAEIASLKFQNEFNGKQVMKDKNIVLGVEKFGKVTDPIHQVDGISGGTITSKGVDAMIQTCLKKYTKFLNYNK